MNTCNFTALNLCIGRQISLLSDYGQLLNVVRVSVLDRVHCSDECAHLLNHTGWSPIWLGIRIYWFSALQKNSFGNKIKLIVIRYLIKEIYWIVQVCREYQRGACSREESECRYAHPPRHLNMDTSDGMVTVCMDFIKGKCQRESCKYFHPPSHLQGKVKAAQQQQQQMSIQTGMVCYSISIFILTTSWECLKII